MANIVEIPNQTQGLIQKYLADSSADEDKKKQLELQQQQINNTNDYQQGMLKNQTTQTGIQQQTSDMARYEQMYKSAVAPYLNSGRPEDFATAKANIQQIVQQDPTAGKYFAAIAMRAQGGPLPEDQANASATKFKNTQLDTANSSTDPNAANYATKVTTNSFMPAEGFKQQQATDLASRDKADDNGTASATTPNLTSRNPSPGSDPVANAEAVAVGAMPNGAENLGAQTQIAQTNIQDAGATTRQGMQDTAAMDREKYKMSAAGENAGKNDVRTTVSGQEYADVSSYTGNTKNVLTKHYKDMGIPVLSSADVSAIREVDNARLNQQMIAGNFLSRLPKDPTGRVMGGALENKLSAFFQTDEYLASVGTLRTAAIQALRATAGSKGLRINEAEIAQAVENDIPKITDTISVAMTKMKLVGQMLDNAEDATLGTFVKKHSEKPSGAAFNYVPGHGLVVIGEPQP